MNSASTRCGRCTAAVPDAAVLCHACTDNLAGRLHDIPVLLDELDLTFSRQATGAAPVGSSGAPRGSVHPDMTVSLVAGLLRASCLGWAHAVDGYTGAAPWKHLLRHIGMIRLQNWSVMMDQDLAGRMSECWQKIDRPADRWYAGTCGAHVDSATGGTGVCSYVLWANLTDDEIQCGNCHTRWTVGERRAWLIRSAEDFEGNATMVASVVSYVTQKRVAPATVRSWTFRGLLIPSQRTVTKYRVGDVIAVAMRNESHGKHVAPETEPAA